MTNSMEIIKGRTGQFAEIVSLIQQTRTHVIRVANAALIDLYWNIGQYISEKIGASDWGDGVVKQLADYIAKNAPEAKGFSDKNLWRMKQFYETYKGADEKLSPLVRQISWTNNLIILSRTKTIEEKEFYLKECIQEWSQNISYACPTKHYCNKNCMRSMNRTQSRTATKMVSRRAEPFARLKSLQH